MNLNFEPSCLSLRRSSGKRQSLDAGLVRAVQLERHQQDDARRMHARLLLREMVNTIFSVIVDKLNSLNCIKIWFKRSVLLFS
jgi:hypothetical protein